MKKDTIQTRKRKPKCSPNQGHGQSQVHPAHPGLPVQQNPKGVPGHDGALSVPALRDGTTTLTVGESTFFFLIFTNIQLFLHPAKVLIIPPSLSVD